MLKLSYTTNGELVGRSTDMRVWKCLDPSSAKRLTLILNNPTLRMLLPWAEPYPVMFDYLAEKTWLRNNERKPRYINVKGCFISGNVGGYNSIITDPNRLAIFESIVSEVYIPGYMLGNHGTWLIAQDSSLMRSKAIYTYKRNFNNITCKTITKEGRLI